MGRVYEVEFTMKIDLSQEGINIDAVIDDISNDNGDIDEETLEELKKQPQYATGKFHILANELGQAYLEACDVLEKDSVKEYEINQIKLLKEINIVNLACDCPFCKALTCSPDERLDFKCDECGEEISVADGWNTIICPNDECSQVIFRKSIKLGSDGKYYIDTKINEEEWNKENDNGEGEEE